MLYSSLIRPLLFRLDPEVAHRFALALLSRTPLSSALSAGRPTPELPVNLFGLTFRNPLGIAAGVDKNGIALPAWEKLGFGFCEIGTITRHAQPGNARPRIFRHPRQEALVNRLGFPNDGAELVARRLLKVRERHAWKDFPIGINIGMSKVTPLAEAARDYVASFQLLHDVGDYFVVNVSSPNTPGLRELQEPEKLRAILSALQETNQPRKPLLVKIAPDLNEDQLTTIVALVQELKCAGIVATNTTVADGGIPDREEGGLSGRPLRQKSTEMIRSIRTMSRDAIPVIGAGGVFDAADFREKIDAGASLVQLYTGLVFRGPLVSFEILGDPMMAHALMPANQP